MDGLKNEIRLLFNRDNNGDLIPKNVSLENDEIIQMIPLTRGDIKVLDSLDLEDREKYILLNCIKNPKYNIDEINYITPEYCNMFINTVYENSGIVFKKSTKNEDIEEDSFGKELSKLREQKKESRLILFLHEMGYNFFNVSQLTYAEIDIIIDAWNNRIKEQERESKGK